MLFTKLTGGKKLTPFFSYFYYQYDKDFSPTSEKVQLNRSV